ncbi:MAG: ABC transporter substrate-binding protein [Actinobacteria bacterium]|nr:ABC transporter substrate-binding protein [Actinomycetota bacterium]
MDDWDNTDLFSGSTQAEREDLTRRQLLERGGLALAFLGAGPFLAACGGKKSAAPTVTSNGTPKAPNASGQIAFISWQGYDAPKAMASWKKAHHVTLKATYMGNHDEIQTKILAARGSHSFDLITYAQAYKPLYKELNILTPIDENKIPNLKNLIPFFASDYKNFWVDADGTRTGVPLNWGYVALAYDSDAIKQPQTYRDLLDPSLKGKIGMPDDLIGVAQLGAHVLGIDITKMSKADFGEVKDFLRKMIAQTKGVSPTYGDLASRFAAGDVVAAFCGWPPIDQLAAGAGKKTIKTYLPKDGGVGYCDSMAIPTHARNTDTVHAWINATLEPKLAAQIDDSLGTATPVKPAIPLLTKDLQAAYPWNSLDGFFKKAPLYALAPFKSDKYVTWSDVVAAWQQLKAGG